MSKTSDMSKEQVLEAVRPVVEANQPSDYRLVVKSAWMSPTLGWIVAVDVDRDDVDGLDWAKRLVDIEEQVQRLGHDIHVHPAMYRGE